MKYYLLPIILLFIWTLSSCSDSDDAKEFLDRVSSQRLLNSIKLSTTKFKASKGKLPTTIDDLLKHDATFKNNYEVDYNRLTKHGHTITISYSPRNFNTEGVLCGINVDGVLAFELTGNGNFIE